MPAPAVTKIWSTNDASEEYGVRAGKLCFDLSGTFVASIVVQRKAPVQGSAWITLTIGGVPVVFTGPASETFEESADGARYRMLCTSYGSGSPTGMLQQ